MHRFLALLSFAVVPHLWAEPVSMPYTLQAESVEYDDVAGKIVATGKVDVTNGDKTVTADTLTYVQKTDTLTAAGNVQVTDKSGQTLTLDTLELTDDMKHATLAELRLRVPELGEIFTASSGSRTDEIYELQDAHYSPCPLCETGLMQGRKAWSVKAKKVTYDREENQATYRHAVLDVYGMPVFYTPYFAHAVDRTRPKNGLLSPRFGHSTNMGDQATLAYYHYLPEQNADVTLRTRFMSSRGLMGQVEHRQEGLASESDLRTSFIKDDRRDEWRGNAKMAGEYAFDVGRRVGLNGEFSSDDTYLADFFGRSESYLPSTAYFEDSSNQHYFGFYATHYQDLNTTRDPEDTAHILPRVQFQKVWDADKNGGDFIVSGDAMALSRSNGNISRRMVGSAEYLKPWILGNGKRLTYSAKLRGDIYSTESTGKDGNSMRVLPETSLMWDMPLTNVSGNHTITPIAMAVFSPRGGNPEEIPNEDSVAYELDANNLFSTNRFAGLDRVESGPRFIYGLDNSWGEGGNTDWRLFVGQSYRMLDDSHLPTDGGTQNKQSDWVGFAQANPTKWLAASSLFRLDTDSLSGQRMDNDIRIGEWKKLNFHLTHTKVQNGAQELQARVLIPLTKKWELESSTRRDINDGGRQLEGETALTYKHDCYNASFLVRRRGYTTVDLQPSTDYLVNIDLLTFGQERD
ncbi:MAG: LPS assembly protein LptD [Alphaproteobacteria bacterium]